MSIQSHDASQRTQGLLCLFAFAKEILTAIGALMKRAGDPALRLIGAEVIHGQQLDH